MYCIDTDIAIEFLKGNQTVKEKFKQYENLISTTPITALELSFGAQRSIKPVESMEQVNRFLDDIPTLSFDRKVYEYFGKLKKVLIEEGRIIDGFDLIIASFCLVHDKILITNNIKHFERIPNLKINNWLII